MNTLTLDESRKATAQVLLNDIWESIKLLEHDRESQFFRRTYVRTLFASLEGFGRLVRSAIMESDLMDRLDASWYSVLREKTLEPEPNGKIKANEARFRFVNLFAATIRAWAELNGMSAEDISKDVFGVDGWNQFQQALRIRNALTHPKVGQPFDIDDAELLTCFQATNWWQAVSLRLFGVRCSEIGLE